MKRNLIGLALIVSLGVQVIGALCQMEDQIGSLTSHADRLTNDVQRLTKANLILADQLEGLADGGPGLDMVMLGP